MAVHNSRLFGFPDTYYESSVSGKTKQSNKIKKINNNFKFTLYSASHNLYPLGTSTLTDLIDLISLGL